MYNPEKTSFGLGVISLLCFVLFLFLFRLLGIIDLMMSVYKRLAGFSDSDPHTFSLPSPLPLWPQGQGFGSGRISLGELEVYKITEFEPIWRQNLSRNNHNGLSFYKPVRIPNGFHCLGHFCHPNNRPLRGFVLVARESDNNSPPKQPALCDPLDYVLVWSPDVGVEAKSGVCGYIWLPRAPDAYKPVGLLVTDKPDKPGLDEVRCVRADLTDECEAYQLLLQWDSRRRKLPFRVWSTRPRDRGMIGKGVPVGTFFCGGNWDSGEDLCIGCLKNLNPELHGMPKVDQIHAIIDHYGPTVFFHPKEVYLPSSVSWFFENGAVLCRPGVGHGEAMDACGSNLPCGGTNDGEFWIDLPSDKRREIVKRGNLESAKLYVHVKPALGGTFTDVVMWVFCPFNGPATLKVGRLMNIALSKIGEHVGDWEHFTLRICNFTGELWSIYFAQHSGGKWVDACDLEYIEGSKAVVYSSINGHASYPHPGTYIQGSSNLGVGIRNDAARSDLFVDSSKRYELVAAQYLGDGVVTEPCWLQFMGKWGPKIVYDSRTELDKVISWLPMMVRHSVANWFRKFPVELYGEEGPTGPKEKNYWVGDERG